MTTMTKLFTAANRLLWQPRLPGHSPGRWAVVHSGQALATMTAWIVLAGCDTGPPATPAPRSDATKKVPLPDVELVQLIDQVLDFTEHQRPLTNNVHAAWQILHGVLAFGDRFEIMVDEKRVKALEWVLSGGNMTGWTMRRGEVGLKAVMDPGSKTGQGHADQWLAIIAQSGLGPDHPIKVGHEQYTINDLVVQAKYDTHEEKECSWTLIGLTSYLPINATWQARDGSNWSIERLMALEADQRLNDSACGGSHRLIGMTMALNRYVGQTANTTEGPAKLSGGWKEAQEKIDGAIERARAFQLPNGAFSIRYFERSSNSPDLAAHLGATGHTLEFLTLALNDQQLAEPWVSRAVEQLCRLFQATKQLDLECGALYHAAHALALYRQRRFGPHPTSARTAESSSTAHSADHEPTEVPQSTTLQRGKSVKLPK